MILRKALPVAAIGIAAMTAAPSLAAERGIDVKDDFFYPTSLKIKGRERKYVLKKALHGVVPAENMYRRKQGFAAPIGSWIRGDLRSFAEDLLLSPRALARGYFRPDRLTDLVLAHSTGRADHSHRVWSLLMLELWHREMTDTPIVNATAGAVMSR